MEISPFLQHGRSLDRAESNSYSLVIFGDLTLLPLCPSFYGGLFIIRSQWTYICKRRVFSLLLNANAVQILNPYNTSLSLVTDPRRFGSISPTSLKYICRLLIIRDFFSNTRNFLPPFPTLLTFVSSFLFSSFGLSGQREITLHIGIQDSTHPELFGRFTIISIFFLLAGNLIGSFVEETLI